MRRAIPSDGRGVGRRVGDTCLLREREKPMKTLVRGEKAEPINAETRSYPPTSWLGRCMLTRKTYTPDIEGEAVAIRADGAFTPLGGKESITEPEPLGFGRHSHALSEQV
jgi:hypothetical protein